MHGLLGMQAMSRKKFPDAVKHFQTMHGKATGRFTKARAANNIAYMYCDKLNRPGDALPFAEAAAKALPDNPNVLDTLAWTLAKLGKNENARAVAMRAVQLGPRLPMNWLHLAHITEKVGITDEAVRYYNQALAVARATKDEQVAKDARAALDRLKQDF